MDLRKQWQHCDLVEIHEHSLYSNGMCHEFQLKIHLYDAVFQMFHCFQLGQYFFSVFLITKFEETSSFVFFIPMIIVIVSFLLFTIWEYC